MWDLGFGVLNSIGLFNPGVHAFLEAELPQYLKYDFDYGLSIAGYTRDEFFDLIEIVSERLKSVDRVKVLELNFSCPNVKTGGIQFAGQPEEIERITSLASSSFEGEVWVKVSPAYDVSVQVEAALKGGATAAVVANTFPATYFDKRLNPVLGAGHGGLSGSALFPINLKKVAEASRFGTKVVASGGIDSFHKVLCYLKAGAVCVGLGTVLFRFPDLPTKLYQKLLSEMKKAGLRDFSSYVNKLRSENDQFQQ